MHKFKIPALKVFREKHCLIFYRIGSNNFFDSFI
ncbi:uncharacterized protein METZ01_LOCUS253495 [marine metagenome]|uniref:Uncharacterized protein n=1 Tax=marine metagenome TaxID=408172 RepID=A0A382IPP8_9ZZZZ